MSPPPTSSMLTSSLEVSEIQEELVKLNLRIKMLNEEFSECVDEKAMELLNEEVRHHLDKFRYSPYILETCVKSV